MLRAGFGAHGPNGLKGAQEAYEANKPAHIAMGAANMKQPIPVKEEAKIDVVAAVKE